MGQIPQRCSCPMQHSQAAPQPALSLFRPNTALTLISTFRIHLRYSAPALRERIPNHEPRTAIRSNPPQKLPYSAVQRRLHSSRLLPSDPRTAFREHRARHRTLSKRRVQSPIERWDELVSFRIFAKASAHGVSSSSTPFILVSFVVLGADCHGS